VGTADALPAGVPGFEVDIANPHYGPNYQDGRDPANYMNPVPVFFLPVKDRAIFRTAIALRVAGKTDTLERAFALLTEAVAVTRLSGKTAVGYGRFEAGNPRPSWPASFPRPHPPQRSSGDGP